jgi:hypothetical protein
LARVLGEGYTESEAVEHVAGFLDAEGCFSLRLRRKPEYTLGFYFVPIITAGRKKMGYGVGNRYYFRVFALSRSSRR